MTPYLFLQMVIAGYLAVITKFIGPVNAFHPLYLSHELVEI